MPSHPSKIYQKVEQQKREGPDTVHDEKKFYFISRLFSLIFAFAFIKGQLVLTQPVSAQTVTILLSRLQVHRSQVTP